MTLYRANQGDMLDAICKNHYGTEANIVRVYEANPGLAELGPVLPLGTVITLPEIITQKTRKPIRLWSKRNAG